MSVTQRKLKATLLEYQQIKKVGKHARSLRTRLKKEKAEFARIAKKLKRDERDLERLEKTSMRSLFHKVLGDKEKQVEKDRQKYLQTALKYNELGKSIELMEFELSVLEKKLTTKEDLQKRFRNLMRMRERELMRTDPVAGRRLIQISKQIDHAHVTLDNIKEASAVGKDALKILRAMEGELANARNWGQWDTHGDRRRAGWMKHQAIDRAKNLSYKAKHILLQFRKELADIYRDARIPIHLEMRDFNRFTDILFDNLISDWVFQQRIKKALDNVQYVKRQVSSALKKMKSDTPRIKEDISRLERDRERQILNA